MNFEDECTATFYAHKSSSSLRLSVSFVVVSLLFITEIKKNKIDFLSYKSLTLLVCILYEIPHLLMCLP